MSEPFVRIRDLHKEYQLLGRHIPVLRGVDLEIGRGDLASITGKSGVGKSTLLQVLGTLDAPTRGEITFDGVNVFERNEAELASFRNQTIGFVFQFHYLLREFTALENTMMPALAQRMDREKARGLAAKILDRVGLSHRLEHKPGELSGGEQQRVALARALVLSPRLLLADEPTGNLDEGTAEGIHDLITEVNRELGTTVLVVTHNPSLAARMPRRLSIEEGRILEAA
ncbi:MAG: ABC transporter ATP-binding protein [Deltaproteobacteria bacterium]|nr:ABC transporter ATP-binding protein [Deltaproteobacteria bacterium]